MKKTLQTVRTVLVWVLTVVAVCMMIFTVVSVLTLNQAQRNLFGYRASIVLSDSMKKTDFKAGDLVVTKMVDCSTLEPGDIISFVSRNPDNVGAIVTHEIRQLTTDANGQPGFVTFGTSSGVDDEVVVLYGDVLGQYKFHLPGAGYFFNFLKTTPGYIVCILLPFVALILLQSLQSIRLFRQYKAEQNAELQTREKELQAMMDELQRLRAANGVANEPASGAAGGAEVPAAETSAEVDVPAGPAAVGEESVTEVSPKEELNAGK